MGFQHLCPLVLVLLIVLFEISYFWYDKYFGLYLKHFEYYMRLPPKVSCLSRKQSASLGSKLMFSSFYGLWFDCWFIFIAFVMLFWSAP